MYVRPPSYRYPPSVRIPDNYSGSAFREQETPPLLSQADETEISTEKEQKKEAQGTQEPPAAEEGSLLSPRHFGLRLGSLFGKKSSIGTEELLIIALILLLSDSNSESFDDLILFLALLFFIK